MNRITRGLSAITAAVMLIATVPANAAFLEDEIFFDDMESYAVGYIPEGITGWGANKDKHTTVQETDAGGNKALRLGDEETVYTDFARTQFGPYTGKLWASVDILFPTGEFTSFRLAYTNSNAYAFALLNFASDGTVKLLEERTETGSKINTTLCTDFPINSGWVTVRAHIDTAAQSVRFYYKLAADDAFIPLGDGEYDFAYKKYAVTSDANIDKARLANFYRIQFASRQTDLPLGTYFYLDNFGIYYDREIVTDAGKECVEKKIVLDISDRNGYGYTFPDEVELNLTGGVLRALPVQWETDAGAEISGYKEFSHTGTYRYRGNIDNTKKYIDLTTDVRDRTIESIDNVYEQTYQFESYTLPETIPAKMNDGSLKNVKIAWDVASVDTSQTGTQVIQGSVLPWNDHTAYASKVTLYLGITEYGVKSVEDIYVGIPVKTAYTLPDRVKATTDAGEEKYVAVVWNGTAPDTTVPGIYNYEGTVNGVLKKVKLRLTVYSLTDDAETMLDVLKEYYGNVLTEGRDRTRYGVAESEPHPVFAAGINRLTGQHALWSHETAGEIPLTDLASQTCLMKGLMGFTQVTGDEKYKTAVYDAYRYYMQNCLYNENGLIAWGGHEAFNMETYQIWDELDTHELKDHYPLFDVMYDIDPDITERYIKAVWKGHVHNTENLEFSRHFTITKTLDPDETDQIFAQIQGKTGSGAFNKDLQPFYAASEGLITFITAANDFIAAAGELYALNGDENALQSAIDLQNMYLKGRHTGALDGKEGTGLIPFLFTSIGKYREPIKDVWDDMYTNSGFGDRIKFNLFDLDQSNPYLSDFGAEYDYSIDITIYCYNPMVMLRMASYADEATKKYLTEEAVQTLASFIKVKYDDTKNMVRPMLIDGTDLTGYVAKRSGYCKNIGVSFEPWELEADYLLAFIRGYNAAVESTDEATHAYAQTLWDGLRNVFDYYGVGDVGTAPGTDMLLDDDTSCEEPFVVISLCELYNETGVEEYLNTARAVAKNIADNRFQDGYFYETDDQLNANFNSELPYAVMYYIATEMGISKNVPEHFGSRGYFQFDWWQESTQEARKLYSNKLWAEKVASEVLATSVALQIKEREMTVGERFALLPSVEPEDTADKTVEYKSSDENVCIIDEDGIITAVGEGEATVTATAVSGGCETTALIRVKGGK